jgi:hypothetical protein
MLQHFRGDNKAFFSTPSCTALITTSPGQGALSLLSNAAFSGIVPQIDEPPLALQPARRQKLVGGTQSCGVVRDCSSLGEPLRTDDRCRLAEASVPSAEAAWDLASRRGLSENQRSNGLPLAGVVTARWAWCCSGLTLHSLAYRGGRHPSTPTSSLFCAIDSKNEHTRGLITSGRVIAACAISLTSCPDSEERTGIQFEKERVYGYSAARRRCPADP